MSDARVKLVVSRNGMTIAGERYRLTTDSEPAGPDITDAYAAAVESGRMEAIITELEALTQRSYGQFCGLSRALELVGERWSLMIIRDLLVTPKSLLALRRGLPRIPIDVLAARLRELEHAGIIHRADGEVYRLTEFGAELEDILLRMARWGARLLGEPRAEEIMTADSMVLALRAVFRPEAAVGVRAGYEIRLGDVVFHARVEDGVLHAAPGPLPGADLIIEPGTALKALMTGELGAAEAVASGSVTITGDPVLLERFADIFHITGRP